MATLEELDQIAEQRDLTSFEQGQRRALTRPTGSGHARRLQDDSGDEPSAYAQGAARAMERAASRSTFFDKEQ